MKKFLVSLIVVGASLGYVVMQHAQAGAQTSDLTTLPVGQNNSAPDAATITTQTSSVATTPKSTPITTPAPVPTPTPAPKPVAKGQFNDGTYTGVAADAYYGYVQVAAVISGGKLTNVKILQYPSDRSTSREINSQALPMLIQEAISAQSGNVNAVSGASDSSMAFNQSMSSALAKAKV